MGVIRGLDCKLYYNSGTYGGPTWVEITDVQDLDVKDDKTKGDASRRASPVKQEVNTQRTVEITWNMVRDPADSGFTAIQDSYQNDDLIEFALADGDINDAGTTYTRWECQISSFGPAEHLTETSMYAVSASPTYTSNDQGTFHTV